MSAAGRGRRATSLRGLAALLGPLALLVACSGADPATSAGPTSSTTSAPAATRSPATAPDGDVVPVSLLDERFRPPPRLDEGSPPGEAPLFADVTDEAGLAGTTGTARLAEVPVPDRVEATAMADHASVYQMLMFSETYFISGQAWRDVDGDDDLDLYLTDQRGPNRLLLNRGDGTFAPAPPALAEPVELADHTSGGATFVDVDNDGWPDLHVLGEGPDHLFRNEGGRRFTDITERAGIDDPGKGMTAAWGDLDGDGWLDAYVVNYGCQPCEPDNEPPVAEALRDQDRLFVNDGDGTFTDRTGWIDHIGGTRGLGFSASWFDHDGDGRQDLYLVNDVRGDRGTTATSVGRIMGDGSTPGNVLIRNGGPGCGGWCLEDVSEASGAGVRGSVMGLAVGDVDRDGDDDLFFTNAGFLDGPTTLLRNDGDGTFTDVSAEVGANLGEWSWGTSMLDVDSDGRLDIHVVVGYSEILYQVENRLLPELLTDPVAARARAAADELPSPWIGNLAAPWPVAADPHPRTDNDRVLLQGADGRFVVHHLGAPDRLAPMGYGSAVADYDDDGRPDVVVGNLGAGYALLRNRGEVGASNHRVVVELEGDGERVSRDAAGARVVVQGTGGARQGAQVRIGSSLGSGESRRLHFGLGDEQLASVEVRWPDGEVDRFTAPPTDHRLTITYGRDDVAASRLRP